MTKVDMYKSKDKKKNNSTEKFINLIKIIRSDLKEMDELIRKHIGSLIYPMDSYLEDMLIESDIYKIIYEKNHIGYTAIKNDCLNFFYMEKGYFRYAPIVFEKIIEEKDIKKVFIMTQDNQISTLISEWDYEKEKHGCCFTDSLVEDITEEKDNEWVFKKAVAQDLKRIIEVSGNFFDEESGGFKTLEERIEANTIFMLEDNNDLLGFGIYENSQFNNKTMSIGMFVNRKHRKKGVAKCILQNLKRHAYNNNLKPVSGCWYYNTLSRKSLESAGMIATSIAYEAVLKGKEVLPLRTGNPPGELV